MSGGPGGGCRRHLGNGTLALLSVVLLAASTFAHALELNPTTAEDEERLGLAYWTGGNGVAQDREKGLEQLKRAADHGRASAANKVGMIYANGEQPGLAARRDAAQAIIWFEKAVALNDPAGMVNAANGYATAPGFARDNAKAADLYRRAADLGNAEAADHLATMYVFGRGVAANPERARQLFQSAIDKGWVPATLDLADMYIEGRGIPKDVAKGIAIIVDAAGRSHPQAVTRLAIYYSTGAYGFKDASKEFFWMKKAASFGNASAWVRLGNMYHFGSGTPKNEELAAQAFKEAVALGNGEAAHNLSTYYRQGLGVQKDEQEALRLTLLAAERNVPLAQCNMSAYLHEGRVVPQDDVKAAEWAEKAMKADSCGEGRLGDLLIEGAGVPKDVARGLELLRHSADNGNFNYVSQHELAKHYLTGDIVGQDFGLAMSYFQKASAQGDLVADSNIAFMYASGKGVPMDVKKAMGIWRSILANELATDADKAYSAFDLFVLKYREATVDHKNEAEAEHWLQLAIDNGHPRAVAVMGELLMQRSKKTDQSPADSFARASAQGVPEAAVNLGVLYLQGRWVQRDDAKAADWFRKAADMGEASAQYKLAILYLLGRGVAQDDAEAARWLRKAADQDFANALTVLAMLCETGRGTEKSATAALALRAKIPPEQRMDSDKAILTLSVPVSSIKLEMHRGMIRHSTI